MKKLLLLFLSAFIALTISAQWTYAGLEGTDLLTISGSTVYSYAQLATSNINSTQWNYIQDYGLPYPRPQYTNSYLSFAVIDSTPFTGTWVGVFALTGTHWQLTDSAFQPVVSSLYADNDILYAGTEHGLFVSYNKGSNWDSLGLTDYKILALAANGSNIFAISTYGIYSSFNSGVSWKLNLSTTSFYSITLCNSSIYAGTLSGVYVSNDNGNTWNLNYTGLPALDISSIACSGSTVFAGTSGNIPPTGGVFVSTNKGSNWNETGLKNTDVFGFAVNSTTVFASTGIKDSGVWRSPLTYFTAVEEPLYDSYFNIYPNPAANTLVVETSNFTSSLLQIFNIAGQLVLNNPILSPKSIINTSNLPSGIYTIFLKTEEGVTTKKLIIAR